jgi:hypothetical protein
MSDNIRELNDTELNIVGGGFQSAAFGAIANNRGSCSRLVPAITNNGSIGGSTGLGYGGLSGSYGSGPCDSGGPEVFLLMEFSTQISMEFAEADEAGPQGRALNFLTDRLLALRETGRGARICRRDRATLAPKQESRAGASANRWNIRRDHANVAGSNYCACFLPAMCFR